MIQTSVRRFAIALCLSACALAATGTSLAQTVTGTDPCPKNMLCSAGTTTAAPKTSTATTSTSSSPSSTSGTVMQAILVLLGAA